MRTGVYGGRGRVRRGRCVCRCEANVWRVIAIVVVVDGDGGGGGSGSGVMVVVVSEVGIIGIHVGVGTRRTESYVERRRVRISRFVIVHVSSSCIISISSFFIIRTHGVVVCVTSLILSDTSHFRKFSHCAQAMKATSTLNILSKQFHFMESF